jgi:hypothetical protein
MNVNEVHEVRYWTQKWGVSKEQLAVCHPRAVMSCAAHWGVMVSRGSQLRANFRGADRPIASQARCSGCATPDSQIGSRHSRGSSALTANDPPSLGGIDPLT